MGVFTPLHPNYNLGPLTAAKTVTPYLICDVSSHWFQAAGMPTKFPVTGSSPTWTLCLKSVGLDISRRFILSSFSEPGELTVKVALFRDPFTFFSMLAMPLA